MSEIKIANHLIGDGHPCYIIAEMSANHGGSLEKALAIVRAAKEAGADAIKLQTYTPDTMTIDCDNEYFRLGDHPLWGGKTLYQLYGEAMTPWEWHDALQSESQRVGIDLFSTPFDESAVDFLEMKSVPAYKVASFELIDDALLKKVALAGKPVIMSTGMASLTEITHAVDVLRKAGVKELALLRCVSSYPARPEEMELSVIPDLKKRFGVVSGLSDHTMDATTAIAAVALGASIIEKHFKLADGKVTPDSAFSMPPEDFRAMVRSIRVAEKSIGAVRYGSTGDEQACRKYRRSVFFVRDVLAGERLTRDHVRVIRPGHGVPPGDLVQLLGLPLKRAARRGEPLTRDVLVDPDLK